ncbi:amidohydrolase family protein [Brevibacterium sp. UCMA 11754]|uniref:amidohydrolase family protein n=1 Tax=Brevibacterium sp. UCMA 11754 TaxID=2749198 RepID=UPI001F460CEF|nr:amidohydrolase family protein [Brevibacterium sp. UCMA 11754]MCF2570620.1 amidohydrolase family protein [Brevibacterium sp. UCMA 11754]
MTVLHNIRLVDPVGNGSPAPKGNGSTASDFDSSASTGAELVDVEFSSTITSIRPATNPDPAAARFLVPGLIDTHVHLGERSRLIDAVRSGLTTVVDLGTHPDSLVHELQADDALPAIISAGSAASAPGSTQIEMMGFPAESGVTSPDDAKRFLDWRVDNGADLIKIIIEDPAATEVPALSIETLRAIVDGAHARGLLTVAHVVTAAAFDRGLDADVDVLTHAPLDRALEPRTLDRMRECGTVVSPTLVMMRAMADARLGDHADAAFAVVFDNVRAMLAAGITVIAGTDANETPFAPVHHGPSLHDELDYLITAGMTTGEAIRAATSSAAEALNLRDRGRIVEGARADLVLVDRDPITDVGALRTPAEVWVAGVSRHRS